MAEDPRHFILRLQLPRRAADLPWARFNWVLHVAWFCLILVIWNCAGDEGASLNTLSISITALEIFLGTLGLAGFWILRGEVRERVERETREMVHHEMHSRVEPQMLRLVEQYLEARDQSGDLREDDVRELMRALDEHGCAEGFRPR
jgi:hypothetical protein